MAIWDTLDWTINRLGFPKALKKLIQKDVKNPIVIGILTTFLNSLPDDVVLEIVGHGNTSGLSLTIINRKVTTELQADAELDKDTKDDTPIKDTPVEPIFTPSE